MKRLRFITFKTRSTLDILRSRYSTSAKTTFLDAAHELQQPKKMIDYDYFVNAKSKRRVPSALREIMRKISKMPPEMITFAVGVPNGDMFPFKDISVNLKDGSNYKIEGKNLSAALQYLPSDGYGPLVKQLQGLQDRVHGQQDWTRQSVMVTCGSSEPMANVFEMVLREGDPIIIPIPLYTGTADALRSHKPDYIGLEQDKDGVRPEQLRTVLEERVQQNKSIPKLMYINPTACNPTGRNLSVDRKKEIYRLACEYNFIILEDDPYYYLHFMEENIPSLLSMDVEGRVMRLDSFSKILSSGLRLGYLTGPRQLVRQIELHNQVSTLHTSGVSQMLVSLLLDHWGHDRYFAHIEQVKKFYKERRDLMVAACERYLKGLAEWNVPLGGMFMWVKIPVLQDTWSLAVKHCVEKYLLIVPGHPFTGELTPPQYNYIRLSFSLASPAQMDQGVKLLSEIILEMKNSQL